MEEKIEDLVNSYATVEHRQDEGLPLPKAQWLGDISGHTDAALLAYGQACRKQALEDAINCYSPDDTASSYIEKIEDLKP